MMAMTAEWLTRDEAASRLQVPEWVVLALAFSGHLRCRRRHDHVELFAADVQEFDGEHPSRTVVAEHGVGPFWTPWSSADDPEARLAQADYDPTPNDEGDET